ncbi:hypothetical protein WJX82_007918 [Trebouxia sp. C0006]
MSYNSQRARDSTPKPIREGCSCSRKSCKQHSPRELAPRASPGDAPAAPVATGKPLQDASNLPDLSHQQTAEVARKARRAQHKRDVRAAMSEQQAEAVRATDARAHKKSRSVRQHDQEQQVRAWAEQLMADMGVETVCTNDSGSMLTYEHLVSYVNQDPDIQPAELYWMFYDTASEKEAARELYTAEAVANPTLTQRLYSIPWICWDSLTLR